jgi:hypothetical protein
MLTGAQQLRGKMDMTTNRGRLLALRCGAGLYILILANEIRYIGKLPLSILIVGTLLNGGILVAIIVALRRTQRANEDQAKIAAPTPGQTVASEDKSRNVRSLWIAAGFYFIAMLIASQYATRIPPQFLALAGILNVAIILTFVVKLRRAYLPTSKSESIGRSRS